MKGSSLHAMVRLRRPLRCDYVIQTDHMEGNSLHAMLGLHRAEQPLEKQLPARYAAITSSRVTTERQVPACYAAITASKMTTGEAALCMLWWDYGVENDHFRGSTLHAMLGFGRPQIHFGSTTLHAMLRLRRPK